MNLFCDKNFKFDNVFANKMVSYLDSKHSYMAKPEFLKELYEEYMSVDSNYELIDICFVSITGFTFVTLVQKVINWDESDKVELSCYKTQLEKQISEINKLIHELENKNNIIEELRDNYWRLKQSMNKIQGQLS